MTAVVIPALPTRRIPLNAKWQTLKVHARYSHRDSCVFFKHNGQAYLSYGYQYGGNVLPELWRSADGIDWHLVNGALPYQDFAPATSFGGDIVAVGDGVWQSTDGGASFTQVASSLPFTVSESTNFTWRLLADGGTLMLFAKDRIWHTTDLENWSDVLLPWENRQNAGVLKHRGKWFILAGNSGVPGSHGTRFNDVWAATDPLDAEAWQQIAASAPWAARQWPSVCSHSGHIVMVAGYNGTTNFNDTWISEDGVSWQQVSTSPAYSKRHYVTLLSMHGRLILQNGNQNPNVGETVNDVLELIPA